MYANASTGRVLTAKHASSCPVCRLPIAVDAPIIKHFASRRWAHKLCVVVPAGSDPVKQSFRRAPGGW